MDKSKQTRLNQGIQLASMLSTHQYRGSDWYVEAKRLLELHRSCFCAVGVTITGVNGSVSFCTDEAEVVVANLEDIKNFRSTLTPLQLMRSLCRQATILNRYKWRNLTWEVPQGVTPDQLVVNGLEDKKIVTSFLPREAFYITKMVSEMCKPPISQNRFC